MKIKTKITYSALKLARNLPKMIDNYKENIAKEIVEDAKERIVRFEKVGGGFGDGSANNFIAKYILAGDGGGIGKFGVDMYNIGDTQFDNDVEALDPKGKWNM